MALTLKTKFIIIGGIMVAAIAINATLTYHAVNLMDSQGDELREINVLVHGQLEGDALHDALRTDATEIKAAVERNDPVEYKTAVKDADAHEQQLDNTIATMQKVDAPENIKQQVAAVIAQFNDYKKDLKAIIDAGMDAKEVDDKFVIFDKQFDVLKKGQEEYEKTVGELGKNLGEEQNNTAAAVEDRTLALSLVSLLLALAVPVYAILGIFRPQAQMISSMQRIAGGDTAAEIPHTKRTDEMGDMARTVQVFKDNAQRVVQLAEEQKNQQAIAEQKKREAMQELAKTFEANVKGVVDMVASAATEMDATSKSVAKITETNQGKLGDLNTQIGSATRNVQMVASASSQLSAAIGEINKQVMRASTVTSGAVEEAKKTDVTVQGLSEAAQKIGEVVEMINSIAAQINLLALNATIEAARAGDAGKGFAVVASEVKSLATQTTKATEQIAGYISSIQNVTGDTVAAIKSIGGKIHEINEISTTIAAAVEEQSVATKDIASNVQQAAQGTEEVSRNASDVATSSRETGESANQMMAATSELSRQSEVLRREVDKFLVGIRG